jgi:membrane protein YqaA with SNARE-associated domain
LSEARQTRSAAGTIGAGLGSVARYALNPKARNKVLRAAGAGLTATANSVRRTTHVLWLEVTGFFFLVFATVCGGAGWKEYQLHLAGMAVIDRVYGAGVLALLFAWFGVSSFWRARRQ